MENEEVTGQEVLTDVNVSNESLTVELSKEQFDYIVDENKKLHDQLDSQNEALTTLNENIVNMQQYDYTQNFNEMIEKQTVFIDKIESLGETIDLVNTASSSIITYSVFYLPLIIVGWMLWWFFRQWIR